MPRDHVLGVQAEALHETGANLWNEFARYRKAHGIPDEDKGLVMIMEDRVFECHQKAFYIETQKDYERLHGELDFARNCLHKLKEQDNDAQPT